jgi:uncharacterized protein (TIGR02147 family)
MFLQNRFHLAKKIAAHYHHEMTVATWLTERFVEKKNRNSRYSLRAFAASIGVSPASLSKIMSGRMKPGLDTAQKIADHFAKSEEERATILRSILLQASRRSRHSSPETFTTISDSTFNPISNWYHYAILGLADFSENIADPKWISKRLSISVIEAKHALERMTEAGLIEVVGNSFRRAQTRVATTHDVPSAAIRSYHSQNLELANRALEAEPIHLRDFSAITFGFDHQKMPQAKLFLKRLRRKFWKTMEGGSPERVYTLSIQFFPVSKK